MIVKMKKFPWKDVVPAAYDIFVKKRAATSKSFWNDFAEKPSW